MFTANVETQLRIIKKMNSYHHFGEINTPIDLQNRYQKQFWNIFKKQNKGYRKVDLETAKIYLGLEAFNEQFAVTGLLFGLLNKRCLARS